MATKPLSLNDLLKSVSYPAGGFSLTPKPSLLAPFQTSNPLAPFQTPPAPAAPAPNMSTPNGPVYAPPQKLSSYANPAPVPPPTPAPVPTPSAPQAGPTGATGPATPNIPPQWLNADGSFKTPDQVASDVGSTLKTVHGTPDAGALALDQFKNKDGSTADAEAAARKIGNTRNDIAVGETDPYGVGASSGIQYTPAELSAIEHAYAGVYDPALDTALAKVNSKQQEDARNSAPYTLGKDDVRYDSKGNVIAVGIPSGQTGAAGTYVAGADPTADAYVKGIQSGTYKASDIPDAYKGIVAQGISAATGANAPISKTSNDAIGIINQLQGLGDDALGDISGTGFIGGIEHPSSLFPGTAVQNTQNLSKQLQGTLSLANRNQLHGQGSISDFEFRVLGDASSALGIDDKTGRTNLSPEDFKKQLGMLKTRLSVGLTKTLTDDEVQALSGQGYTPQQIRDYDQSQQGFNSVGNTSASMNIPQKNNNPGNVKAGGISDSLSVGKDKFGHLIFKTPEDGFKALTADLTAKVNGGSSHLPANPTIEQLATVYAEDPKWGKNVATILGVPVSTPTKQIPIDKLAQAIAHQEGFYA